MLKQWLEVQGYAVMETGWTRSKLIGQAITDAKMGHSLQSPDLLPDVRHRPGGSA